MNVSSTLWRCFGYLPRQRIVPLLTCLLLLTRFSTESSGADKAEPAKKLDPGIRVLCEAYVRNCDSFQRFACQYELRSYRAPNADFEEIFHKRIPAEFRAYGVLARVGKQTRAGVHVTPADAAEQERLNRTVFVTRHHLASGNRSLYFTPNLAVLMPRKRLGVDCEVNGPFSWGEYADSYNVETFLREPLVPGDLRRIDTLKEEIPHSAVISNQLVGFEQFRRGEKDATLSVQLFLSPKHGHLPVVCRKVYNGKLIELGVVTEIKELDGGRFFPMRRLLMHYDPDVPQSQGKPYFALEMLVTKIEFEKPIPPSLFQIELPQRCILRDSADDHSQMILQDARTVAPNDIDQLYDLTAKRSQKRREFEMLNRK